MKTPVTHFKTCKTVVYIKKGLHKTPFDVHNEVIMKQMLYDLISDAGVDAAVVVVLCGLAENHVMWNVIRCVKKISDFV